MGFLLQVARAKTRIRLRCDDNYPRHWIHDDGPFPYHPQHMQIESKGLLE